MQDEHIFKHPILPFVECRYSKNSHRHYKPHLHQTFSVGALAQGAVSYQIAGQQVPLQPGSLALINPEILHACNPLGSGPRSYYMLHLDVAWCGQVQQSLWPLETFSPVNTIVLSDRAIYEQYLHTLTALMADGRPLAKEQILVELLENIFLQACEPRVIKSESAGPIDKLKRQLSQNLARDISLRQLAQKLPANPYTLLRQFRAATGITPHAYRLNCRIELGKKLLRKGVAVSQVALACGFYDQSHFHRHFKALTSVTPKEYQVNFIQ